MMRKKSWWSLAVCVLSLSLAVGCAEEEKPAEEVVQPVETEEPATPPEPISTITVDEATQTVYFAFDDYTLSPEAQSKLNTTADYLRENPAAVMQVEGHCDERGSIEYNLALGQRRAQSVKNYLVELGIDPSRLPTISYGEEKPAVQGHDESAWSQNRRAEFVLSTP
jgi:peptidoglycan-associated lipoprotein